MKRLILFAGILSVHAICFSQKSKTKPVAATAKSSLKTAKDTLSYAIGAGVADNLVKQGISDINYALVQKAMEDVFKKRTRLLDENTVNMSIQKKLQEAAMKRLQTEKDKGAAFLAQNKKRKEVTTLENGLQYEIIDSPSDTAAKPTAEDTVVVNYVGTLIDGKEFDNSVKRGQAATFPVNGVIKGWTEILQLMPVGSKWKVYIPSELGYGDRGAAGGVIPGGATLIFEISLEGIKPKANQ